VDVLDSTIDFNAVVRDLYLVAACAGALSIVTLLCVSVMRIAVDRRERALNRMREQWQPYLAAPQSALEGLRAIPKPFVAEFMVSWNAAQEATYRAPGDQLNLRASLNRVARELNMPALALAMVPNRDIAEKIVAITMLGHLRGTAAVPRLREFVDAPHPLISFAAARAMLQINRAFAYRFVALMSDRYDWSESRLSTVVREESAVLEGPILDAVRSLPASSAHRLVSHLRFLKPAHALPVVRELLDFSIDPGVLAAALKVLVAIGEPADAVIAATLAKHESWYVRVQAATALGQLGNLSQTSVLSTLLEDRHWWVRYRAAQSLALLLPHAELQQMLNAKTDRFARDVLVQLVAEYVPALQGVGS
jgi:HEAT repeats